MELDFDQAIITREVLMELNFGGGKRSVGKLKDCLSEGRFDFEQHHAVGGNPIGCKLKYALIEVEPVYATIESEGGLASKDGEAAQCMGGDVRWVGTKQVKC